MGTKIIINQGAAQASVQTLELYPINSSGDPDACRRLVHPNASIPPLVYSIGSRCHNPTRTVGFDLDVLLKRITTPIKTLGSTRIVDYSDAIDDSFITEIWTGSDNQFSMTAAFWRDLYVYYRNPPPANSWIVWEPRDRSASTYNVQIVDFPEQDILEVIGRGGSEISTGTSDLEPSPTGLLDRTITLKMKIVSVV